jgi:hypothetical protein
VRREPLSPQRSGAREKRPRGTSGATSFAPVTAFRKPHSRLQSLVLRLICGRGRPPYVLPNHAPHVFDHADIEAGLCNLVRRIIVSQPISFPLDTGRRACRAWVHGWYKVQPGKCNKLRWLCHCRRGRQYRSKSSERSSARVGGDPVDRDHAGASSAYRPYLIEVVWFRESSVGKMQ